MEMVSYLTAMYVRRLLSSEVDNFMRKSEKVPIGEQSWMVSKSKMLFKTSPGHATQDIVDVLHISHMSVVRKHMHRRISKTFRGLYNLTQQKSKENNGPPLISVIFLSNATQRPIFENEKKLS